MVAVKIKGFKAFIYNKLFFKNEKLVLQENERKLKVRKNFICSEKATKNYSILFLDSLNLTE